MMASELYKSSAPSPQTDWGRSMTLGQSATKDSCVTNSYSLGQITPENININMEFPVSNENVEDLFANINTCLTELGPDISGLDDFVFRNTSTEYLIDSPENNSNMIDEEQNLLTNAPLSPPLYSDTVQNGRAFVINHPGEFVNDNQRKPIMNIENDLQISILDLMNSNYPNEDNNVVDINNMTNDFTYNVAWQPETITQNSTLRVSPTLTDNGENKNFIQQPLQYVVQYRDANECNMSEIQDCNMQPVTPRFEHSAFAPLDPATETKEIRTCSNLPDGFSFSGDDPAYAKKTENFLSSAFNIINTDENYVPVPKDEAVSQMVDSFLTPIEETQTSPSIMAPTQNIGNEKFDSSVVHVDEERVEMDVDSFLNPIEDTKTIANTGKNKFDSNTIPVDSVEEEKILKSFRSTFGNKEKINVIRNVKIATACHSGVTNKKICLEIDLNKLSKNKSTMIEEATPSTSFVSNRANSSRCENSLIKTEPVASISYEKTDTTAHPSPLSSYGGARPKRTFGDTIKNNNDGLSNEDNTNDMKKTRLSLHDLTDAEKYKRIREQNNIASRKCREKKREEKERIARETLLETAYNKRLAEEYASVQKRLQKWHNLYLCMVKQT